MVWRPELPVGPTSFGPPSSPGFVSSLSALGPNEAVSPQKEPSFCRSPEGLDLTSSTTSLGLCRPSGQTLPTHVPHGPGSLEHFPEQLCIRVCCPWAQGPLPPPPSTELSPSRMPSSCFIPTHAHSARRPLVLVQSCPSALFHISLPIFTCGLRDSETTHGPSHRPPRTVSPLPCAELEKRS